MIDTRFSDLGELPAKLRLVAASCDAVTLTMPGDDARKLARLIEAAHQVVAMVAAVQDERLLLDQRERGLKSAAAVLFVFSLWIVALAVAVGVRL